MGMPEEYRIKRSCRTKVAVRENLRNLEKLLKRNCALMMCCLAMLLCMDTHFWSLDIFDEMENCGAGG
jgi:hypothetical protein